MPHNFAANFATESSAAITGIKQFARTGNIIYRYTNEMAAKEQTKEKKK